MRQRQDPRRPVPPGPAGDEPERRALSGQRPAVPSDPAALAALSRTIGNAAVQRILARQRAKTDDDVVAPHEGGDDSEGLIPLAEAAPAIPAEVTAWNARTPKTNPEYATWILDAEALGFVQFLSVKRSKVQLESLRDGKKVVGADPAAKDIIGGLVISRALIAERASRWIKDPAKPKDPFVMGDYIRQEVGGHSTGERVDIGGFDWTGANGPGQVITALNALPADKYGIGLPFQGEFFPDSDWFEPQAKQAVEAAQKAGKTTAEITTPLLAKGKTTRITGTWSADDVEKRPANWDIPAGWTVTAGGPSAVSSLKSSALKTAIKNLNAAGYDIYVFPDNPRHLHIQKGNG